MARKTAAAAATAVIEQAAAPAAADQAAPAGSFESTVAALKNSAAGAVAGFDTTQQKVKTSMEQAVKSAEEIVSFSQGNFEAMMKAGQIWAAGVQDLHKTFAATAQAQVEAAMGTMKALSGVKSLKEAMDLQASLARASLETAVSESGKLTDASIKLAEQTMAPLTARVTLAVEKFARVG
jgi:phasin family protein